jgi:hypothetical protein
MKEIIVSRHIAGVQFIAKQLGGEIVPKDEFRDYTSVVIDTLSPELRREREEFAAQADDEYHGCCRGIHVYDSVNVDDVKGKIVYGNIPFHLACEAEVVYAIEFDSPPRAAEYSLEDMENAGAKLVPYLVFCAESRSDGFFMD